ncbi:MAG: 30S ribosomal protein S3 [Christensenellaceae bacterium]|jgi:small subunit ribosomal protein S3|nr:30S ribosomal protein S3 [Christensenellaceae bacterium]
MGQKVNPHGFRVGVIKDWDSRWITKKSQIADFIVEDDKIRKFIKKEHYAAGISKIEIERAANKTVVYVYTARPGIIIGKAGAGIDELRAALTKLIGKNIAVNIIEVRRPDADAQLIAENVASQLERRISFRRAMKQCISRAMKAGIKGIKIKCGGRLGGAEIARAEEYHEGSIPLQTIRADIDYGLAEAATTYGRIGVKVWVYKGEVLGNPLKDRKRPEQQAQQQPQQRRRRRQPEGGRRNADA